MLDHWKLIISERVIQPPTHTLTKLKDKKSTPSYFYKIKMPFCMNDRINIATKYVNENDAGAFTYLLTTRGNEELVKSHREKDVVKRSSCCSAKKAKKPPGMTQVVTFDEEADNSPDFGSDVAVTILDYIEAKPFKDSNG